jgi:peptidoglycan/LPS O-acetylase OafA/YrhL
MPAPMSCSWVPPSRSRVGTAALALLAVIVLVWDQDFTIQFSGGYTAIALLAGFVIVAATGPWRATALLQWAPLRQVGKVSYGLYLWHLLCLHLAARELADQRPIVQATVGLALSAAATWLSWRCIEQPFLRRKARFTSDREPAEVPMSGLATVPAT